jgi:hypothetical protein
MYLRFDCTLRNSGLGQPCDIDIFEAKTVPPAPGRYRQAG